jgi:hypothetical protein
MPMAWCDASPSHPPTWNSCRHGAANRIGFAVQLSLLRYPGMALEQVEQPAEPLVQWLATRLEHPECADLADKDFEGVSENLSMWDSV